jgi:hypothetical protein
LFDCSLSLISLIIFIIFIFNFIILFCPFFSSISQAINFLFSKRKVLAQSFKTRPFQSKACKEQAELKEQKVKAEN